MNMVSTLKLSQDVKWVFESASLIDEGFTELNGFKIQFPEDLKILQDAEAYLNKNPLQKNQTTRLGLYFEYVFKFGIENYSNHKVTLHNYRLKEHHNLGEIDFITEDEIGKYFHWEIALKFYLQHKNGKVLENWIGPNAKDNFNLKWQKLIHKQIPFSQMPEVKKDLALNDISIEKALLFVKGMLFYHPKNSDGLQPEIVNPFHKKGWWIYPNEFSQYFSYKTSWLILEKFNWIGTPDLTPEISGRNLHEMIAKSFKKPLMVALIDENENLSHGFIVPPSWPNLGSINCKPF